MKIKRGSTVLCDAYLKNNSFTVDEIMGEQTLTLNFLSRDVIDFEVGDYVECEGERYKIRYKEKVTKREKSLGWEYNIPFYSSKYDLEDVVFFLNGKPEYKKNFDSYTGTARQILELIVKNMNREDSGWKVGSCIESRPITISFKDKSVGNVLDDTVKQIDTEYWISQKTVSIGKRKYDSNGLVLGQGEGLGFTELEVSSVDEERPTTVIYPYGSDKNLGPDYGADYLMLPGGLKEMSKNTDKYGRLGQKKIQFDHIFPKGEFLVTTKIDDLTLQASGIDFNLKDCLLDEVEAIVTFQDGGLAGYDLAIVKESVDDKIKQFKLKENKEENALTVPGDINFAVGDKFILTGIKMPQVYIDNASSQLAEEAQTWLDEHCEKRIQLRGKCDEVLFRQMNLFIACGQMVGVYSDQLKIDREIRVTKVKRYIENDDKPAYRYELTLSDFLQGNGFKDLVDDVDKFPDEIEDKVKPVREWTKRSWRDVMETLGMMFDPEGDYFTELIKPLAVHTAQLIVGTNSQQMDLIGVKFIPNADNDPNYFKNTAGKLVHFTVSETVREWSIPAASFRLSNSLAYYVYAKCPKEGSAGSILVSERQIKLEAEAGYYYFWIGVLNTPEDSIRSWNPNYGFTEMAGQTITTGIIKDKLARLVIDLVNAHIIAKNGATISGKILFGEGTSGLENIKEWPATKKIIDDAVREIGETSKALTDFEGTVNGAFKDGVIEQAEAKAIEKYINTLNTEKADTDAVYTKLYSNIYLLGSPKTDLLNSKITYNGAHTELIKAVIDAIADGRTTVAEKNNVDSKFTAYKNAIADYKSKMEAANKAIQDTLKSYSDEALAKGKEAFTAASNAQASANQAQQSVSGLGNYIDGAFSDGIIQESEAKAIEKYINTVKTDKAAVEATYNKLYVNSYLTGTAKSGLLNAKVTLFGAIDNLLSAINSAISDGKTTVAEKNNVDSKFSLFNSAMSSFNTAVETANKAIQDTLKSYSDNAASNVPDSFKDSLAQRLGYTNYAALEAAADAGNTVVKNGKINTVLLEAAAIVAKGITAEMIEALDIETSRLKVLNGAKIGKFTIEDGWLTGYTSGLAEALYNVIKLRHTKSSDGSFSQITLGSNVNNSLFSNQRVTSRIYNGISNKNTSIYAGWGDFYRNTALQLEANYADVNLALETIGGRMHRGRLWEIEEVSPITGGGTYSPQLNGSIYLFRDLKADLTFELPLFSTIQGMFGNFQSGVSASQSGIYTIRIFIDRYCSYRVLVAGTSTTPLLNHNGDIQNDASGVSYGARWMSRGDFMVLVFYNKAWYIQCYSN
nr:MAG TPA: Minor structural protein putative tail fiber [Caudoviricetes sp.]